MNHLDNASNRIQLVTKNCLKKTQALRAARDEIRASLATSETALEHLDAARRLEPVVLAGPRGDNLSAFLMALSKLDEAAAFLSRHKSGLVAAAAAAESVAALRSDGNALALRDYEATTRGAYDSYAGGDDDGDARREQKQQQQQPQGIAVEARKRELTKRATASKQTRLRSLARALVSGGGPEASAPSVLAFLISEKRQEGEAGGVEKDGKGCMKRGEKKKI